MATDFRMPAEANNKQIRRLAIVLAVGFVVAHLLRPSARVGSSVGTAVFACAVLLFSYHLGSRHVWVTVGHDGLSGKGYTGRKIQVAWNEPITIVRSRNSGNSGVELRASANDGLLRSRVLSLFIPDPILQMPGFRAAVHAVAPSAHPIHMFLSAA